MKKQNILLSFLLSINLLVWAQPPVFTHQDTLRGSIGYARQHWDVTHYNITVAPDFNTKNIEGKNTIRFTNNGVHMMQIDLQEPMQIDSVAYQNRSLTYNRDGNAFFIQLPKSNIVLQKVFTDSITIYFSGKPKEARNAPWDGGWIWKKDNDGNPWMSVACQGLGASVWYPCKDSQSDEPNDGASLTIIVPDTLIGVGNGRMIEEKKLSNQRKSFTWAVVNPINNYNIVPYIGKYSHWGEIYKGLKGNLTMDYWVLNYNVEKAKTQFKDADRMMKAFEYWFGPYPFYEDGYKLVEAPHLGMEHQSAIAYGNHFKNGYLGKDLSGTGEGLKWDFIIVHESGHEWFGNNITSKDIADMWIHEGFTNYSETLFTDFYYGTAAGNAYNIGCRKNIRNDVPIIGPYGVNKEGSGDMYYKASAMIHTIRQIIHNDKKFRAMLNGLNRDFYHQTVTTAQIESYINHFVKINFSKIFDQYLTTTQIPILEYKFENKKLYYRFTNCIEGFQMRVKLKGSNKWVNAGTQFKYKKWKDQNTLFEIDPNFYIETKLIQ
ncbi:MAG: M1 family metallopeptidase [Niastella sp.]|nr:M1 family metallopeptidase [Niastella sp.]